MKKRINTPELSDEAKNTMASQVAALFTMSRRVRKMSWRMARKSKKVELRIIDSIVYGDWEQPLKALWRIPGFEESFHKSVELLRDATPFDLPGLDEEDVEDINLGSRQLAKVYEYMSGRDFKTTKKVCKGAFDV